MGKIVRRGTKGVAAQYLSRNKAINKLQISLKDFRRLCILKGVFPRDPKKKPNGNKNTTYYHKKDVLFLSREPLLNKFRQFKTFLKKYNKAVTRKETDRAERLKKQMPKLVLDHLIRERYPTFVDALRDLDDPLSMLNLFANLPSGTTNSHSSARYQTCLRLTREFNNYVIQTNALRKCFVSIKGVYFQAEIENQLITWIVPHKFSQDLPTDVDYRVMMTFLDFYETLLRFVNFKLYQDLGLMYPPEINVSKENDGFGLGVVVNHKKNQEGAEDESSEDSKQFLAMDVDAVQEHKLIFRGKKFFLSRETPQEFLEFVILAGGGSVVVENPAVPDLVKDQEITHQVVDRNVSRDNMDPSREYIQPQWVFDSLNESCCLPIAPFGPGVVPPAHLSPFVVDEDEGYVPKQREVLEEWTNNKSEAAEDNESDVVQNQSAPSREQDYLKDLSKEFSGVPYSQDNEGDNVAEENVEEESAENLAKIMMSKKHARLYQRMQYGLQEKRTRAETLRSKRVLSETNSQEKEQ